MWFLFVGVALYSLVKKKPLGSLVNAMLFATGLCPLATDLLLRYPGAELHGVTFGSFVLTLVVCACVGFILPAGLAHSPNVHKGYCLYSAALPMGLTAFFLRALLYKMLGGVLPEAKTEEQREAAQAAAARALVGPLTRALKDEGSERA